MQARKKCQNLHHLLQSIHSALKNVKVKSKPEAQQDADVQAAVKEVADKLGEDGRILVRESGTEPVIRVMVEARTDEEAEKCVDYVVDVINKKGHAL